MERRTLIIGAAAGGIGLLEYAFTSRWMNGMRDPAALSVKAYERFGPQAALMAITPNDEFYLTSKGPAPAVDRDKWQLNFDGLVEHPFTLNFEDLLKLPRIEKVYTLEDRKSTRLNSSHPSISYAVFCLKKKKKTISLRIH